ncbi:zinc finger protein OZF-like [Siniperca chuatsi]|uniref:zinc finger protein OZF-like n=1 Tax=Siniperca chuatsi TaxID=119488 RepID=UPI001CE1E8A7|nr:zinc finger protein OZF-like [Siniperca chuatsi]
MSKVQMLRAFVNQRLSAAAEEIFGLFERTIAEHEEELCRSKEENERQRKLLDAVFQPEVRLHRADVQQLSVRKEKVQEWSPSLDQDPELPHIKEEQEELWTSQEGEQLRGLEEADITEFPFAPVKSEEDDDEEKPQSSQLHQSQTEENRDAEHLKTETDGEDCGGPEPARNFNPDNHLQPAPHDKTSHSSEPETDDSCDWEETREPQSGLNPVPVSDQDCNTGKTSVSSSECATSFGYKEHLQKHNGIQTAVKPFSCSVCGKKYPRKKSLTTHMRLHSEGKRITCSFCTKTFKWRGEVVRHMRIHTGEKPFRCSVCGKRFAIRSSLTSHLRSHTGEKPYSCSVCKRSFSLRDNLVKHMRMHTGEKPFSCSVCGNRFARKDHLRQHLKVHTGEKPFNCSVCGKRFAQRGTLRRHFTVHTGEKRFSCSVCDKRFTRLHNVKKHKCAGESRRNK